MIQQRIQTLAQKPRIAFLLDGGGAVLTALLPLAIVYFFGNIFGIPLRVLYFLSGIACLFALYSFACALMQPAQWRPYLRFISMANFAYCFLTVGLMLYFRTSLSALGAAYFCGEILVLLGVVWVERAVVRVR
jgi:hypothetical protein